MLWNKNNKTKIIDNIITCSLAELQNYKSFTKSDSLKVKEFYEMTFDAQPNNQIIKKGQQIGLMIFSSDSNYTLLPKPGIELTISLEGTKITITAFGREASFKKSVD